MESTAETMTMYRQIHNIDTPFDDLRKLESNNSNHPHQQQQQQQQHNQNSNTNSSSNINDGWNSVESRIYKQQNESRPLKLTFYKNGDKYFIGKLLTIKPSRYITFKDLMNDLNKSIYLPYGVRRVYSPTTGDEITDIDGFTDGSSYVCASFEPFRPTNYGQMNEKQWNSSCKCFIF
jgi:hypothetical protein